MMDVTLDTSQKGHVVDINDFSSQKEKAQIGEFASRNSLLIGIFSALFIVGFIVVGVLEAVGVL